MFFKRKKERRFGSAQGKRRYDLPLDKGAGSGFLVLLIAMMTFLAVTALAAVLCLGAVSERWSSGLENRMTIEIPAERANGNLRDRENIEELTRQAAQALEKNANVKDLHILGEREIQDLISPWLGHDMILDDIPLPGLISVETHVSNPEMARRLQEDLEAIDKTIRIDTHQSWLGDLLRLTGALQAAALLITLVIGATTVTAVAGAVRARMAVHRDDVELLHIMGAGDEYITKQFQRHALILAFKGSLTGTLVAALLLILLVMIAGTSGQAMLPGASPGTADMLVFLVVPLAACAIAAGAARFTVLRVLSLMP